MFIPLKASLFLKIQQKIGLRFEGLIAMLFVFCSISCSTGNTNKNPPNVIIIMADDLGYETIRANGGSSYETPELDKMAASGMRFEHCYSQPLCTPSRVKLMTGIYNVRNYVEFGLLDTGQTTFGHLFQKAGFNTGIAGKWQLGRDPKSPDKAGFDSHCLWQVTETRADSTERDTRFSKPILQTNGVLKTYKESDYGPEIVSQFGLDFIERSHQEGKPFLLYYPMILTHCPFSPSPDSPKWMKDSEAVMTYKGKPQYFGDMVSFTDKIVGQINDKLEELNIKDNTLIIFLGDNGTDVPIVSMFKGKPFAGAKGQSIDGGTHVPMIVQWPKVIKSGSVANDLVDFSDFLPTICEAANVELDASVVLDGKSFLPRLHGDTEKSRDWVYNWYSRTGEVEKAKVFVRNQRFKLYDSGEFYEVPKDNLEENPLDYEKLDDETKSLFNKFREVLDGYKKRRLEDVSS